MRLFFPGYLRLAVCVAALAASLSADAGPALPAGATAVPMHVEERHASVEVLVNGVRLRMLLDTGADQNVLTAAAAQRLGLKLSRQQVASSGASGSGGAVSWATLRELRVGTVRQRRQLAFVVPLPAEFRYDGILGTPFFAAFVATLDYQAGELRLVPPAAFVPPPGAAPVALRREGNKLLVTATAGGVAGWYVVDTGAGNALTFTTPTVERHQLRQAFTAPVRMLTGVSVGGYTYGDLVRVPAVQLGPHRLEHVLAELSLAQQGLFANPAYAGNLGGELWRRFTVTLDYAGGQLYLAANSRLAEPFEGPRAGLAPHWEQGRATVLDVAAASPAATAGVQVGDELLALDGTPMSQVGPAALRQALRQAPGTSLRLRLRRGSAAEQEVVLVLREML